jgi:hypothetical protein
MKVDHRDEQVTLDLERPPVGVGVQRQPQRAGQLVQADDGHQRGVLEQADEVVHDARHHHGQRLRQHDLALRLPVRQAQRGGGFDLALGDGLQAAADDFGHVGRGEQRDAHQHTQQNVNL